MKKQLKEELITLAGRIVQIKGQEQINSEELKELARGLYEKLTVLNFTEQNLFSSTASNGNSSERPDKELHKEMKSSQEEFSFGESSSKETKRPGKEPSSEKPTVEDSSYKRTSSEEPSPAKANHSEEDSITEHVRESDEFAPDGTEYNDADALTEPNTEKIKDIVAQMPPESQEFDEMLEHILPRNYQKNDMEDIGGVHYDQLPQFEPVTSKSPEQEKPRSLNERLKKGIQIGVNDRHAFVRHLFDGSNSDYNRVLSQLNTIKTKEEAVNFVLTMVKPDYNNWEGKEEYEIRFLAVVESKYE